MVCKAELRNLQGGSKHYKQYNDVENDCKFMVVQVQLDGKSSSELPSPRLIFRRVKPNGLAKTQVCPVRKDIPNSNKEELLKARPAPLERSVSSVPFKKRWYVEPPADEDSVTKQVLTQSVVDEKPHLAEAMSSDESESKKKLRDEVKKQQPEAAALPQPMSEASSSQMRHAPCQDSARAGTSATGLFSSTQSIPGDGSSLDEMKRSFFQLDYSEVLRDIELTKEQNELLEQALMHIDRKMSHIKANSKRFMKQHRCLECEFSISHQCMPLDFIQSIPFGTELMKPLTVPPHCTIICDCGFAFNHAHLKRSRYSTTTYTITAKTMVPWREHNRSVEFNCPKCYLNVAMTNRVNDVCGDLTIWEHMSGADRGKFYNAIQRCMHFPPTDEPSFDNFYACSKGCCLLFHRCSGGAKILGDMDTTPG